LLFSDGDFRKGNAFIPIAPRTSKIAARSRKSARNDNSNARANQKIKLKGAEIIEKYFLLIFKRYKGEGKDSNY